MCVCVWGGGGAVSIHMEWDCNHQEVGKVQFTNFDCFVCHIACLGIYKKQVDLDLYYQLPHNLYLEVLKLANFGKCFSLH